MRRSISNVGTIATSSLGHRGIVVAVCVAFALVAMAPQPTHALDTWRSFADLRVVRDVAHEGNNLWLATASGIVKFDKTSLNTAKRFSFYTPFDGVAATQTVAVAIDGNGNRWFAHDVVDAGLSILDSLDTWRVLRPRDGLLLKPGAKANTVFATGDSVWAGTESGVTLFVGDRVGIRLDADDGLPSDNVRAIARTGNFVWIGTNLGLARLEGGVITTYRVSNGLVSNDILSLSTRGDEVWVGTSNGISVVTAFGDTIRPVSSAGLVPPGSPTGSRPSVFDIAFEDTVAWVGTNFGAARLEEGSWKRYPSQRNATNTLFGRETRALATVGREVWSGNSERGGAKFDPLGSRPGWQEISLPAPPTNFLGNLDLDANGDVWMTCSIKRDGSRGTYGQGLKYNGTIFSTIEQSARGLGFTSRLHDVVRVDSRDQKWFGFWDLVGGLNRLNSAETRIDTLNIDALCAADANRRQACTGIRFDSNGRVWGSFDQFGIACLAADGDSCVTWINQDGISNEAEGATANAFALDKQGRVWIGFFKSPAVMLDPRGTLYDKEDDIITLFPQVTGGLPNDRVHAVEADTLGRIWFGTEAGVGIYDPFEDDWTVYRAGANILDASIRSIAFLPDGSALIGDNSGNVYTLDSDLETFGPTYNLATVGFPSERVSAIKFDARRSTDANWVVWFATYGGGLVRLEMDRVEDPPPPDPNLIVVYPNPFLAGGDADVVTFDRLRAESTLSLYTLAGEMVRQLTVASGETSALWDTRNTGGEEVASGVYFYIVRRDGADYGRGKLAVIR
ncbi:MAG: two-component regulator propeller domain-containing protein [bacterium]